MERRLCLGVLQCTQCHQSARPRVNGGALRDQIRDGCTVLRCGARPLLHIDCPDAYTLQWKVVEGEDTYLIWEHHGHHAHDFPPGGALSPTQLEQLDQQVAQRPDASAHQLRTGTVSRGSVPLGKIDASLADPRKARNAVDQSRERLGMQPESRKGGFAFLKALHKLFEETIPKPFLVASGLAQPTFLTLQTAFMKKILSEAVDDWKDSTADGTNQGLMEVQIGRLGCVTDADHSYFRQGNVVTTCAFSLKIVQWVPVLYTWALHLDSDHYQVHFRRLNHDLIEAAGVSQLVPFNRRLLSGVRIPSGQLIL